ncbi:MAG: FG-GAP repeat protein, partial [Candidatus Omnitrophica bacterium]|nr:FG-GAP repeat protein [Candidatus Omnitrophota bacterium]
MIDPRRLIGVGFCVSFLVVQSVEAQVFDIVSPQVQQYGRFGSAIATLPDITGDGYGDLAIGAPQELPHGRVHLFDGGTLQFLESISYPIQDASKEVPSVGYEIAGVEDLNGDGKGEVLIGAPGAKDATGTLSVGEAFVMSDGSVLYALQSSEPMHTGQFGASVSSVPDVNGDSLDEIAIGAPGEHLPADPETSGRVHLFDGATGSLLRILDSPNPIEIGEFGSEVRGISDVNGNGSGDVIVGAPREEVDGEPDGRVYVFDGQTGELIRSHHSPNSDTNRGIAFFGMALATIPDLDADGVEDYAISTDGETVGFEPGNSGRAYVYSGQSGALIHELSSENPKATGFFGV